MVVAFSQVEARCGTTKQNKTIHSRGERGDSAQVMRQPDAEVQVLGP